MAFVEPKRHNLLYWGEDRAARNVNATGQGKATGVNKQVGNTCYTNLEMAQNNMDRRLKCSWNYRDILFFSNVLG